jgi:hypothetical protein
LRCNINLGKSSFHNDFDYGGTAAMIGFSAFMRYRLARLHGGAVIGA